MKITVFGTVKSKVTILLFEIVKLSVSTLSSRNFYKSFESIKNSKSSHKMNLDFQNCKTDPDY